MGRAPLVSPIATAEKIAPETTQLAKRMTSRLGIDNAT
jgi:hypothetical protein